MRLIKPSDMKAVHKKIVLHDRSIPLLILYRKNKEFDKMGNTEEKQKKRTGVLWIHGGGYFLGMKEMVYMSRALDLVRFHDAVVVSPGYRLSLQKPYPAAIDDCYQTLLYIKENADQLGIRNDQIFVGGESAGGGLAAVLCMMARDKKQVQIAYQMPLYPMLDNFDTESSKDNHARIWNTKRNHFGWKTYLREHANEVVSPYAAAARQTDYRNLPPAYTFVGKKEPFYQEKKNYIENLQKCGIHAKIDVYDMDMHAFDMLKSKWKISRQAAWRFNKQFAHAQKTYFAKQPEDDVTRV